MSSDKQQSVEEQQQPVPLDPIEQIYKPAIVAALANLGNTCFANSSLQALANLSTIVGALRFVCRFAVPQSNNNQTVGTLPPSHRGRSSNVVRCTVQTLNRMENGEELVVRPIELIRSVQEVNETFASGIGEQHDAAEWFLHGVLDAVDDYHVDRTISAKQIHQALEDVKILSAGERTAKSGARCSEGLLYSSNARMNAWKIMAKVDDVNAREEFESENKKRGVTLFDEKSFQNWKKSSQYYSPFVPRTSALDAMRGSFLQETKCNNCGHVSRIFNSLTSFELSFPSAAERAAYKQMVDDKKANRNNNSAFSDPSKPNAECGPNPTSSIFWKILFLPCAIIASIGKAISRCCSALFSSPPDEPVSVDELLWAYCRSRGSNFTCSKCKNQTFGSITVKVLDLPQVMVFHLKRFEQSSFGGMWTEKIPDYVQFPGSFDATNQQQQQQNDSPSSSNNNNTGDRITKLNKHLENHNIIVKEHGSPLSDHHPGKGLVLDLSPFCVDSQTCQELLKSSNENENNNNKTKQWVVPQQISTYTLNSVINHHGGFGSGHYTAFCRKPSVFKNQRPRWALFNDAQAAECSPETVLQSQAYLLMYEKQALCEESDELNAVRKMAKLYLADQVRLGVNQAVKVSRLWLFRVATFSEPGPYLHRVDEFEGADVPPAKFCLVKKDDFEKLVEVFGELRVPNMN